MIDIEWPQGWIANPENLAATSFSVHIECDHYCIYQSGGNEKLWYVIQYWIGEPEESNTDITGQCPTLERAIENLRNFLAGVPVPSGDEITVMIAGEEPINAPVFHNSKGELFVHVPEKS